MRSAQFVGHALLTLACSLCLLTSVSAQDVIRKVGKGGTVQGTVKKMTPLEVVVEQAGGDVTIPVNEIEWITYHGEPSALNTARTYLYSGRYQDALDILNDEKKIPTAELDRPVLKQDVAYYKAYCLAKLALAGGGDIAEAGKSLITFIQENPGSYHSLEARELVGNLLVATGKYKEAEQYYRELAKTPWPDYQIRAGVSLGRLALAQGKIDDAEKIFATVLGIEAKGPQADLYRHEAQLGQARCLAEKGKIDEARKIVENIIAVADPEYQELHARAYNTLGAIERKAGRTKEALMAYLHVDLLYFANGELHAEALANLVELWNELHKPERATRARQLLETRYKNSPWAKKVGS